MSSPSHTAITDGEIVSRVRSGDSESFALIVNRYRRALTRLATSRLHRVDWADDLVQETFLCAFKSLHTYDSKYSFRTWLWTILLNQCRRHQKRADRWPKSNQTGPPRQDMGANERELHAEKNGPMAQALARERLQMIERHLSELSTGCADAIRLRFFGQLKFQEIADALGCSLSTAKHRVRVGLQHLSVRLAESSDLDADAWLGEKG